MGKGSKYKSWLKEGIKVSKKLYKKLWNRKVRHAKNLVSGSMYKKLAKDSMYDGVL